MILKRIAYPGRKLVATFRRKKHYKIWTCLGGYVRTEGVRLDLRVAIRLSTRKFSL